MREPRRDPWRWLTEARVTYALKILMVLVLAFFVGQYLVQILVRIRGVVYIIVGAVFLAYAIYPAIMRLRRRMPLVVAIVLVYLGILTILIIGASFVVPHVVNDVAMLVQRYPDLVARLHSLVYNPADPVTSRLPDWLRDQIASAPAATAAWIKTRGLQAFGHVATLLAGTVAAVATFVVIPVVTAYLLLDLDRIRASLAAVVPAQRWRATFEFLADIDGVVGGFVRGQLLVALMVGILIFVAMMLLHVPYPYLFGLIAGLGDLIPYVGAVLAFVPAFTSAVLTNGWINGLLVAAAFMLIYEAEGHFIAPNIVGRQVRLSPFVVIIALLIGAEVGGLFGMLIAVPVAGVARVVATRVLSTVKTKAPS
jgi:predicted PurR-regulated permease PerM